jgi:MarR family transcriptional regulator, temperature-dependent positive regulator of motility
MPEAVARVELRRISDKLAKLAIQVERARDMAPRPVKQIRENLVPPARAHLTRKADDTLALAEALFTERRRRDVAFDRHAYLLGEPAWDILLFLYIGHKRNWAASVAHATRATGAAATTALRCIARLEADGLVIRDTDSSDRRRILLSLTDEAARLMEDYVTSLRPDNG